MTRKPKARTAAEAGQTSQDGAPAAEAARHPVGGTGVAARATPQEVAKAPVPDTGPVREPGPAKQTGPVPEALSGPVVTVTGPARGRWRAGRHFGPDPVSIPLGDLSEADKQALIADPRLSVTTAVAAED